MTLPLPATGRIGIIAAMRDELSAVLDRMPDEHKTRVAGRSFWRGHWHGREVVAVLSRIGKVAAATTATALIERFGVTEIVFTGADRIVTSTTGKRWWHHLRRSGTETWSTVWSNPA